MITKVSSVITLVGLSLCLFYMVGCSNSGAVWVKQSDPSALPTGVSPDMADIEHEKIPSKTMKDGTGYE